VANGVLGLKSRLHGTLGEAVSDVCIARRAPDVVAVFAGEVAKGISFGVIDGMLEREALRLRMAGILVCTVLDRELSRCRCFVDLFNEQGKEAVRSSVAAAVSDAGG
jgi:hypothetical protein